MSAKDPINSTFSMIHTLKHLYYQLKVKKAEVRTVLADIDKCYYFLEVPKKKYGKPQMENGIVKTRSLYPSTGSLRIIQEKIHHNILSLLPLPAYAFGSVRGKSNILNAKQHLGNRYFFSVDLKKFFPSINNHMVFKTFLSHGFSHTVARVLTQLTTYKGALPQGAPTSPLLANLVFVHTGKKIVDSIQPYKIMFTTYLDDFTFSSRSDFKHLAPHILKLIQSDQYRLSHKKISYKTKNPEVTGVIIAGNKLFPHVKILQKQQEDPNQSLSYYINQIKK